jgi:hypothetical protein
MFYLIQFDNIESEETKQLQFELRGYPNGTILSYAKNINVSILPTDKWIVWIDKDIIDKYNEQYTYFSKIKGIKCFIELDITKSIYDMEWVWDDDYINNIFAYCV